MNILIVYNHESFLSGRYEAIALYHCVGKGRILVGIKMTENVRFLGHFLQLMKFDM